LPSTFAAVPNGSSGIGLTPASFLATAGRTNLTTLSNYQSIVPRASRWAGTGSAEFDLSPSITAFGDLLYSNRQETVLRAPATLSNRAVPATNAFNPFGAAVKASFLFTGIGSEMEITNTETTRAVGGLRGTLGTWDWEVSVLDLRDNTNDRTLDNVNAANVTAALASSNPATAVNVFQDGPGGSAALLSSLIAAPIVDRYMSDALQEAGFIRGNLFSLPAGDVQVISGAEFRSEKLNLAIASGNLFVAPSRNTWAADGEARFPFVSSAMAIPGAREITATVAGRYDHYSDFGGTFNPQCGLQWKPFGKLLIRGSYSTAFRAPSLFELYSPDTPFVSTIVDPRRNNQVVPITILFGGNPSLEPEKSHTWSVGAVLSDERNSWPRMEVNYWNIRQDQTIQTLSPNVILANEVLFPSLIQRAAQTPADVAAGLPGILQGVDEISANFGSLNTDGIDLNISDAVKTSLGVFTSSIAATWVDHYKTALVPGAPPSELVNLARGNLGTIPRWRATASISWGRGPLEVSSVLRYIGSYDDATSALVRTGTKVDSQTLIDMQALLDIGKVIGDAPWSNRLSVRVGVNNLFDSAPPFSLSNGVTGYDLSQADIRGRFLYVALTKSF
jgi:iron complex outermembrane receptor protein